MYIKTIYVSILGHGFPTAAEALADEDRLPAIIALYKNEVKKIESQRKLVKKSLAKRLDPLDRAAAQRFLASKNMYRADNWVDLMCAMKAVADYKKKLNDVREQRFINGQKQP